MKSHRPSISKLDDFNMQLQEIYNVTYALKIKCILLHNKNVCVFEQRHTDTLFLIKDKQILLFKRQLKHAVYFEINIKPTLYKHKCNYASSFRAFNDVLTG